MRDNARMREAVCYRDDFVSKIISKTKLIVVVVYFIFTLIKLVFSISNINSK